MFKSKYTTKEDLEEFEKMDEVGKWLKFSSTIIELETSFLKTLYIYFLKI